MVAWQGSGDGAVTATTTCAPRSYEEGAGEKVSRPGLGRFGREKREGEKRERLRPETSFSFLFFLFFLFQRNFQK